MFISHPHPPQSEKDACVVLYGGIATVFVRVSLKRGANLKYPRRPSLYN